jgi:hypothetical protein
MTHLESNTRAVVFRRPSRSGARDHVIVLDAETLAPVNMAYPCTCAAGQHGSLCHALLDVLADELPRLSQSPDVLDRAERARLLLASRTVGIQP